MCQFFACCKFCAIQLSIVLNSQSYFSLLYFLQSKTDPTKVKKWNSTNPPNPPSNELYQASMQNWCPDWQCYSLWPVYTLALGGCGTIPRQSISGTIQYTLQCTVGRNSESSKVTTKRDHLVLLKSRHIGTQVPSIWISRVSTGCSYTEIIQFVNFYNLWTFNIQM